MKSILLPQVPEALYRQLEQRAIDNQRTMEQEILFLLEQIFAAELPTSSLPPNPVQGTFPITDDWLRYAREDGRIT